MCESSRMLDYTIRRNLEEGCDDVVKEEQLRDPLYYVHVVSYI